MIVTSYVFRDGQISYERLERMKAAVGKEHLVLDLSCRKRDGAYYIVTDRWQKFTEVKKQVREIRSSQKVVNQYYRNMMKTNYIDPQFLDNKK